MARDDPMTIPPFHIFGGDRTGRWLVTCDHATNRVPEEIDGGLAIADEDMARHIAFDPGAAGVAIALGELLAAPAVTSNFSRLVIDPNRGEDDPTLVMRLYDGTVIPGNRSVDSAEVERRLAAYYRPYHDAVANLAARRPDTVVVSVHSFTRQFKGRDPRPWHVGVLSASDRRLSDPFLAELRSQRDLVIGENEPYTGFLPGDAVDRYGVQPGRHHTLIELRNDLIATDIDQYMWAERLAPLLERALQSADMGNEEEISDG